MLLFKKMVEKTQMPHIQEFFFQKVQSWSGEFWWSGRILKDLNVLGPLLVATLPQRSLLCMKSKWYTLSISYKLMPCHLELYIMYLVNLKWQSCKGPWKLSGSCQAVIRQSSGSRLQSSAVVRQSSGSRQAVVRQSSAYGSHETFILSFIAISHGTKNIKNVY